MATPRQTKITVALVAVVVLAAAALTLFTCGQKEYRQYLFLYQAMESRDLKQVRDLLDQGVNVNARGRWKETPLINAALYGNPEVVRLLLRAGADVNAQDEAGQSALMQALISFSMVEPKRSMVKPKRWSEQIEVVSILMQAGADIDLAHKDVGSPRQWAELRRKRLLRNPSMYASLRKSGLADPTEAILYLTRTVLAKGNGTPRTY